MQGASCSRRRCTWHVLGPAGCAAKAQLTGVHNSGQGATAAKASSVDTLLDGSPDRMDTKVETTLTEPAQGKEVRIGSA